MPEPPASGYAFGNDFPCLFICTALGKLSCGQKQCKANKVTQVRGDLIGKSQFGTMELGIRESNRS